MIDPQPAAVKKCAFCAEEIRKEAKICKHCGSDVASENDVEGIKNIGHPEIVLSNEEKAKVHNLSKSISDVECVAINKRNLLIMKMHVSNATGIWAPVTQK